MTVGNGRSETNGVNGLKEPLLQQGKVHEREPPSPAPVVTGFANAGFFSRVWFLWLSPFLKVGGSRTLEPGDVPELAGADRAQDLFHRFDTEWQKHERKPNSLRNALFKTFRWNLAQCGCLAFIKVCVAYVGPALIASFMNVVAGNERFPYEGYVLVCVLIVSKIVEATTIHQLSFHSQRMGMQVRSAIISVLYRKGLRLSSSARESHGAGQIVNLMSVDAQNLADVCMWLNYIWAIPLQMSVAGFLVYPILGLGSVAGLAALIAGAAFSYVFISMCRHYQNAYMKFRDVRVQALVESLSNMKIIKLQAWDDKFYNRVADARGLEYGQLVRYTIMVALAVLNSWVAPVISCLAAFSFAVYLGQTISASAAFTTITIARSFQELLRLFPNLAFTLAQSVVSIARVERYLFSVELEADAVERLPFGSSESAVTVENGSFKWDVEAPALVLRDINVDIKQGSLVFVVGKVGAGKSSFISALQGEMSKISGKITTCGSTACVAQTAWIQNATIQENILFGRPLDKERYELVLERCALSPDLAQMTFGDQTEIGERGLNLSGGQKQRIQLARAVYQDCDIYFLDDVFSAVDAHTGSHLFKECVLTALAEKTVLLVTHQVEFLPKADLILVLRDGQIVQAGKYEELLGKGTDLEALVLAHREALEKVDAREENGKEQNQSYDDLTKLSTGHGSKGNGNSEAGAQRDAQDIVEDGIDGKGREGEVARLVEAEHKESGRVSFRVYWKYMTRVWYGLPVLALVILLAVGQLAQISGDYWVSISANYQEGDYAQAMHFIVVYAAFCFLNLFFLTARPIVSGFVGLLASQSYFFGLLKSVFRAPMSFFDTTPTGRILSRSCCGCGCFDRFSASKTLRNEVVYTPQATTDQAVVDWFIPQIAGAFISGAIQLLGSLFVTGLTVWQVLVVVIPLFLFVRSTQRHYLLSSRELTRMDGLTKAPIIHHFSETISGFSTIRCFEQQERFIETNIQRINANFKMDFHNYSCMEWLGVRLELAGACFIASTALLLIVAPSGLLAPGEFKPSVLYSCRLPPSSTFFAQPFSSSVLVIISADRTLHSADGDFLLS
ncbi:hypothetical protein Mapa_002956 [Marchantia paleacea]|nr:hypothetical protein Mapa_002956 [Marchantia paleacea]